MLTFIIDKLKHSKRVELHARKLIWNTGFAKLHFLCKSYDEKSCAEDFYIINF